MEDDRIQQILEIVQHFIQETYSFKAVISGRNDRLDRVAGSLNRLAEILEEKEKKRKKIDEDHFWALEEFKARNEEYENYSALFEMQKEKERALSAALADVEKKKAEELSALNQQLKASEQFLKAANQQLTAKEQELRTRMADLERFNKLMVGRELIMVELKAEVNSLLEKIGQPVKYETPKHLAAAKSQ